jgi:predicted metal-dependent hydrolase
MQRKVGTAPAGVSVSDLGFRWGSCGKSGVLHFNWRLLQLPVRLVDYVIVHELVHLLERNHTKKFHQIMDRVLPDWQRRETELDAGWHAYVAFGIEAGRGRRI